MNEWLKSHLVCPRDKAKLEIKDDKLVCEKNHSYPIVEDVPVMLVDDVETTHDYITRTLEKVAAYKSETQKSINGAGRINEVDEFVQGEIPYTSGNLYFPVQHKLKRYPIPNFRLPEGNGERLLDVGCNWGRWSIAAALKNYKPVGLDPSLDAVLAARRVSKQLNAEADFVVGDARFLPFADDAFDVGFSYSVLQHFSKENAKTSLREIGRTVKKNGKIFVQMPNKYGIRSFYNHWRRGFTEGVGFEVRYWTPSELTGFFEESFGETEMTTDCYFGLGIQKSDVDLLPLPYKVVVHSSEALRKISKIISPMVKVADSVYLESKNQK
ncbi:MAG TPA: methyltransferase domain-containing protein [Pyrinomonadaceae bacterium]|jgi:ubiquinone/menaquinone biosynthesis C-methylase UbiE/uncharacterized protein YbaR (Trm112 family)